MSQSLHSRTAVEEIPPLFFKYYPVKKWLPDLLTGKAIKFSDRASFNDPFDSRPSMRVDLSDAKYRMQLDQFLKDAGWTTRQRHQHFRELALRPEQFELSGDTTRYIDTAGILCLGTEWTNMLLWSHYAKQHCGICIGFHSHIDVFQVAYPVTYSDEFPIIVRPHDDNDTVLHKTFLLKQRCWEYENEWRIIKPLQSVVEETQAMYELESQCPPEDVRILTMHRGATCYPFDNNAIAEITMGLNISSPDEETVIREVKAAGISIPVFKITKSTTSYSLSRKQLL